MMHMLKQNTLVCIVSETEKDISTHGENTLTGDEGFFFLLRRYSRSKSMTGQAWEGTMATSPKGFVLFVVVVFFNLKTNIY